MIWYLRRIALSLNEEEEVLTRDIIYKTYTPLYIKRASRQTLQGSLSLPMDDSTFIIFRVG